MERQDVLLKSVRKHFNSAYPELKPFFQAVGFHTIPNGDTEIVVEAVVRYIVGQMLSGQAADTIYARLKARAAYETVPVWLLPASHIRECGLSERKARSIVEFSNYYQKNPEEINNWSHASFDILRQEVNKFWGLSEWTASMLAIFTFKQPDVFPTKDGTINRVVNLIEREFYVSNRFSPELSSPYGTYLALIFWKSIDIGYWK